MAAPNSLRRLSFCRDFRRVESDAVERRECRSRTSSRRRWSSSNANSLMATASALSRSGASTDPRYSPRLRMMMTRQLRSFAAVSFLLPVFMRAGRQPLNGVIHPPEADRRPPFDMVESRAKPSAEPLPSKPAIACTS
jgi:hypothetical protein